MSVHKRSASETYHQVCKPEATGFLDFLHSTVVTVLPSITQIAKLLGLMVSTVALAIRPNIHFATNYVPFKAISSTLRVFTLGSIFLNTLLFAASASASPLEPAQHVVHHLSARGLVSPSDYELLHDTIGFAVPAVFCFILRMINKGWVLKKFHNEDWLMCGTMFFYMSLMVLVNVAANFNTNLYPPEEEAEILANPADVHNRILGSKIVIALEQCMMTSTWGVKLCIWTFLLRLTNQLPRFRLALWWLFGYIVLGFVVIEVVYFGIVCRPFRQYWAMPVSAKNSQCATYHNYSIVQMVFNISSDFGLIIIPSVMVGTTRLPLGRKFVLIGIFSMAALTIMAAIMNKYYNFASPLTTVYQLWYIRESSIAVMVGNLICTWQLLQRIFHLRSFDNNRADIIPEPEIRRPAIQNHLIGRVRQITDEWHIWSRDEKDDGMGVNESTSTEGTAVDMGGIARAEPTTLMTLNKDGADAGPALEYRAQHDIV